MSDEIYAWLLELNATIIEMREAHPNAILWCDLETFEITVEEAGVSELVENVASEVDVGEFVHTPSLFIGKRWAWWVAPVAAFLVAGILGIWNLRVLDDPSSEIEVPAVVDYLAQYQAQRYVTFNGPLSGAVIESAWKTSDKKEDEERELPPPMFIADIR